MQRVQKCKKKKEMTAEDALNKIAYDDDRQIVKTIATKQPCPNRVDERLEITIEEVEA